MRHEEEVGSEGPYRLTVAPRFQLAGSFVGRIARNSGVEREDDILQPRDDWRTLSPGELSSLVAAAQSRSAVLQATQLGLIQIPERIRRAWWKEAEREDHSTGFERVFSALLAFFRFKKLPCPERVHLEVAVSSPGLASTRVGPKGAGPGLAYLDPPSTPNGRIRRALGLANLGDEASFVVLLNLPPATLAARLAAAGHQKASALSPDQLVKCFFEVFPREPLLRVRLEPGEGLWLSPQGVVHDGWTRGKQDLDVVVSVRVEVEDESAIAIEEIRSRERTIRP